MKDQITKFFCLLVMALPFFIAVYCLNVTYRDHVFQEQFIKEVNSQEFKDWMFEQVYSPDTARPYKHGARIEGDK